jgi:hypothetical protein
VDVEEKTLQQGSQWRLEDLRIGIVRVGVHEGAEAAELLLRSESEMTNDIVTVAGRDVEFGGWTISLLAADRPEIRSRRERVRLRACRTAG